MKKITLQNSFHRTEITILVPENVETQGDAWIWVQSCAEGSKLYGSNHPARRLLRRVIRTLCPYHTECQCGVVRS